MTKVWPWIELNRALKTGTNLCEAKKIYDVKYIWNNSFLNCGCRWKWRIILDQTTSKSSRAVCSTALYTWWKNRCSLKKYKPRNDGVSRIYGHTLAKQIQFFFLEKLTLSWLSRASGAGANYGSEYFLWGIPFFRLLFPENVWVSSCDFQRCTLAMCLEK